MDKRPISREGFDSLVKELKDLKEVQRPMGAFAVGFV